MFELRQSEGDGGRRKEGHGAGEGGRIGWVGYGGVARRIVRVYGTFREILFNCANTKQAKNPAATAGKHKEENTFPSLLNSPTITTHLIGARAILY